MIHYNFSDLEDTDKIHDSSGFENHGISNRSVRLLMSKDGYKFNGDRDFILMPVLDIFEQGSVYLRVKFKEVKTKKFQQIFTFAESFNKRIGISVRPHENILTAGIYNGVKWVTSHGGHVSSDTWYTILFTWLGESSTLYINETVCPNHYSSSAPYTQPCQILGATNKKSSSFVGVISDFRIYKYPLSSGRIDQQQQTTLGIGLG